jgi:hypothetical protein
MKKLLMFALASMAMSGAAFAQQNPPPGSYQTPALSNRKDPNGILTTTPRTDENRGRYTSGRSGKGEGTDLGQ